MLNTLCSSLLSLAPLATLPICKNAENFSGRWATGWSSKTWQGKGEKLHQYGASFLFQSDSLHNGIGFSFGRLKSATRNSEAVQGGFAFSWIEAGGISNFNYVALPHLYAKQSGYFRFKYSTTFGLGIKTKKFPFFCSFINDFNFGLHTAWLKPRIQVKFVAFYPIGSFMLPIGNYFKLGLRAAAPFQNFPVFFCYWGKKGADEAFLEGLINLVELLEFFKFLEKYTDKQNNPNNSKPMSSSQCHGDSYYTHSHCTFFNPDISDRISNDFYPIPQYNSGISENSSTTTRNQAHVYSRAHANAYAGL